MINIHQDGTLSRMKFSDWVEATRPKVTGTWNLHRALHDHPLDFFWLASSLSSVVEQPGQGNYAAACTFLEAFCQYRHSLGLPASVLNICPVLGVGYVAENQKAKSTMEGRGLYSLGECEFLDFVTLGLADSVPSPDDACCPAAVPSTPWRNEAQVFMGLRSRFDLSDPDNRLIWRRDRRMGFYHNVHVGDGAGAKPKSGEPGLLQGFLLRLRKQMGADDDVKVVTNDETVEFFASEIGKQTNELLLKPAAEINIGMSLAQTGLDSLVAIELRAWIKREFGVETTVLEIMGTGSLRELGRLVATKLEGKV